MGCRQVRQRVKITIGYFDYLLVRPILSGILPTLVCSAAVHRVGRSGAVLVAVCCVLAHCAGVVFVDLKTMCPAVSSDGVNA